MTNDYAYIDDLIARFFEGETTTDEEQELYNFFKSDAVPSHLEQYKTVFAYFENEMQPLLQVDLDELTKTKPAPQKRIWRIVALVAASIAILLAAKPFLTFNEKPFDPYEGSYIVRNGQKVYDGERIREAQMQIDADMEQAQRRIDEMSNSIDAKEKEYESY